MHNILTALLHMDRVTAFGLVAVSLMLIFYGLENRSSYYVLAFAGACLMGSIYGFLQGAWPFGVVEAIWALVALHRWHRERRADGEKL
jgi:sterol desaturase/sphingolipid hydroxylase (fatty acid hydroxylase superfamily)